MRSTVSRSTEGRTVSCSEARLEEGGGGLLYSALNALTRGEERAYPCCTCRGGAARYGRSYFTVEGVSSMGCSYSVVSFMNKGWDIDFVVELQ